MNPKTRHHASPAGAETFAYRGAEWHRKSLGTTGLLYDGDNVIADMDGSTVSRFYVTPMLDQNLSMTVTSGDQAGTYFYSQDERQSVRTLTDSTGAVVARYDYTAFGEPIPTGATGATIATLNRYAYTGRELNPYSGNFYFRYRTYGPGSGIFTARDPFGHANGARWQTAGFATGMDTDPLGLFEIEWEDAGGNWTISQKAAVLNSLRRVEARMRAVAAQCVQQEAILTRMPCPACFSSLLAHVQAMKPQLLRVAGMLADDSTNLEISLDPRAAVDAALIDNTGTVHDHELHIGTAAGSDWFTAPSTMAGGPHRGMLTSRAEHRDLILFHEMSHFWTPEESTVTDAWLHAYDVESLSYLDLTEWGPYVRALQAALNCQRQARVTSGGSSPVPASSPSPRSGPAR